MPEGVLVANKSDCKNCKRLNFSGVKPDFLIFKRRQGQQFCYVVELKDGHQFDTKKARAEHQSMHAFIERNAQHLQYRMSTHFCCFNQDSRDIIVKGFKNKITYEEAMTGHEFCDLLEIDYEQIVNERQREQPENVQYFLCELVKIDQVRDILQGLLRNGND